MTPPTFFGKAEESFFRIVMVDTITAEGVFLNGENTGNDFRTSEYYRLAGYLQSIWKDDGKEVRYGSRSAHTTAMAGL
jgi:hypothetical protein